MIKKIITFMFISSVTVLSANIAYSDVCDFSGYEIGSNTKGLKEAFEYTEEEDTSYIIPKLSLPSIEIEFIYLCPERGINNALVNILMFEDEIAGFYLNNSVFADEDSDQFILTYLKENYSNDFNFDDPNWNGHSAFWNNKSENFFYDKEENKSFVIEQLLITREKYQEYIMDISDKESSMYAE